MPVSAFSLQTTAGVVASSSGTGWQPFGFRARVIHIDNLNTVPIYVKLDAASDSGNRASTTDVRIHSCTGYNWLDFAFGDRALVSRVSIFATSTSASGINLSAWA